MKIAIYQVNVDRDINHVAFLGLNMLKRLKGSSKIESEIYDKVFEGEVNCENLEDVYCMFNLSHPKGYKGRSLSVSDVVEVIGADGESIYNYCDSIGFQCIDFNNNNINGDQKKRIFQMTNKELNAAVCQKMVDEQQQYREWLVNQPSDAILSHCYEYAMREDIIFALENYDLSDKQCLALLKLPNPLSDILRDFENRETDHMENIRDTIECCANAIIRQDFIRELRESK